MNTTDWMGVETEWRHALVDPALACCAEGEATPASEGAAYRAAVALGRSRLFGVALGDWDGVLALPLARAAARRLTWCLQRLCQRADNLPTFWDKADNDIEAREECLSLLEGRMEAWAAFVALDESQLDALVNSLAGRSELAVECRQAQSELALADEALLRQKDFLSVAAGTELLANWRRLLVDPYRLSLPWWLDGSLEEIAGRLWKGLPAGRSGGVLPAAGRPGIETDPIQGRATVSNCESAGRGRRDGKKGESMTLKKRLEKCVQAYKERDWCGSDWEWFSSRENMPYLVTAIKTAAQMRRKNGVDVHSHQWQPYNTDKEGWTRMIETAVGALVQAASRIEACKNFDAQLSVIENVLKETFGEKSDKKLYAYDVAFRIGAWRGDDWLPCRVYLHAGTRKGAEALLTKEKTKKRRFVEVTELGQRYPILQTLPAWQIEDILCELSKVLSKK